MSSLDGKPRLPRGIAYGVVILASKRSRHRLLRQRARALGGQSLRVGCSGGRSLGALAPCCLGAHTRRITHQSHD